MGEAEPPTLLETYLEREEYVRQRVPDFSLGFDEMLAVLLDAEVVSLHALKPECTTIGYDAFCLTIHEHDFFAPAYTAFVPIGRADVESLFRFYAKDQDHGAEAWLCQHHKQEPWEAVRKRIEAGGKWNVAELIATPPNPPSHGNG